ncbi:Protein of unknown function [Cotesia congregata]|uniref:Uncharacterized protein n=1 Tax=Cotesia congregata TaxID=51543 RepID=A0A8J2MYN5_COTCN|nr:Protein of unknown function [Cotesia congregata]
MGRCAGIERSVNVIRMYTNIIHSVTGAGYFCTYTSRYFFVSCPSISISSRLRQSRQSSCAPTLGTPAHLQRFSILPLDSPSRITNTKQLQGVGAGMRAPTLGSNSESESDSEGERLHVDVDCRIKHQHQHWSPIH